MAKKQKKPAHANLLIVGLLSRLDFGKIAKAMEALEWSYDKGGHAPSIGALYDMAEGLLETIFEKPNILQSSSGGFEAWRDGDEIGIRFVLEEQKTSYFDDD